MQYHKNRLLVLLTLVLATTLAQPASAEPTPSYPVPVPIASVPSPTCSYWFWWWYSCESLSPNLDLEQALEKEYWARLSNSDFDGMNDWLDKTGRYLKNYRGPRKNEGRLTMLMAGGHMMLFRSYDLEGLAASLRSVSMSNLSALASVFGNLSETRGILHLVKSLRRAKRAAALIPNHQNAVTFHGGGQAFIQFALPWPFGGYDEGMATLNTLMPDPDACYDEDSCARVGAGTEGIVASTLVLAILNNPQHTQEALDIFQDCETYSCNHTTAHAPFKEIGALMTIAELYTKVGDFEKMNEIIAKTYALADAQDWPFKARLDSLHTRLSDPNGLVSQWNARNSSIGEIQLPLPPSMSKESCSTCHFGGQMVNQWIYHE